MYLHGVASAHRDMRLSLALQVREIMSAATPAIRIAVDMNGLKMTGPHIRGNKPTVKGFVIAAKELHSFGNLQRCDKIHDRPHHTYGVARVFHSRDGISPIHNTISARDCHR